MSSGASQSVNVPTAAQAFKPIVKPMPKYDMIFKLAPGQTSIYEANQKAPRPMENPKQFFKDRPGNESVTAEMQARRTARQQQQRQERRMQQARQAQRRNDLLADITRNPGRYMNPPSS